MTRVTLPTIRGKNCPTEILSQSRAAMWRDFAALLLFGNVGFYVWIIWRAF